MRAFRSHLMASSAATFMLVFAGVATATVLGGHGLHTNSALRPKAADVSWPGRWRMRSIVTALCASTLTAIYHDSAASLGMANLLRAHRLA
jgi:hypothetical protein